jgi:uncharacterized membrane protein YphA (DoxX/SURF4 family)
MNTMILLVLKGVVSLVFLSAGIAKLLRVKPQAVQFHEFHLPVEIMILIGVVEVVGALAIWYEPLSLWAFAGLGCLMLGAIKNHITAKHSLVNSLPAALLLVLCISGTMMVYWLHH